jgi:hypothetical protein
MAVSLRMSLSCIAGLLAGAVVPALAHSAGPVSIPDGATPASVSAAAGACVVEPFARGPSYLLWGPTDRWDKTYWFVRPEDCPICVTPQGIRLNSITLRLLTFAACTFQVRVSVVGVTDATYPEPNETDVICPGTAVDVTSLGGVLSQPACLCGRTVPESRDSMWGVDVDASRHSPVSRGHEC